MKYLIWSIEHGRWWKPLGQGYCVDGTDAGRYMLEEAVKITVDGNRFQRPNEAPNEAIVPDMYGK